MILECPECRTRYLVPDSAIGTGGRTVRCASCRHSWFQEPAPPTPDPVIPAAGAGAGADADAATPPPSAVAAPAPVAAKSPIEPEPVVAPDYDAFAHRPPFRPRRNTARRWTAIAVVAGLLMLLATGAILWLGKPGLLASVGIPIGASESPLLLKDNPIERRELENGSELFAISGQVTNPSAERQRVPDIRAELQDAQGRIVFSWTITPQQRSLPPGGSIAFNSAKLDVPANSKRLELSFAGDAGE